MARRLQKSFVEAVKRDLSGCRGVDWCCWWLQICSVLRAALDKLLFWLLHLYIGASDNNCLIADYVMFYSSTPTRPAFPVTCLYPVLRWHLYVRIAHLFNLFSKLIRWQNITSKFRVLSSVLQKSFTKVSPNYLSVKFGRDLVPFLTKSSSNPEVNISCFSPMFITLFLCSQTVVTNERSLSPLEAQSGIARQDESRLAGQHANC